MNNEKKTLREEFETETGITWINSQGEPDIDYVDWLERKVQSQSLPAVEQPEKSTVIEQTNKEFTREGISFAVNEDQEAVKKASAQFGSTVNTLWLSGRQQGFHAGMEHASKFTDALIQEITSLRYKLSQQPSQPEGKTLEEVKALSVKKYGNDINSFGQQRDGFVEGYTQAMREYANQPRKEWISVETDLPDSSDMVMIWQDNLSDVTCSRHQKASFFSGVFKIYPHTSGGYYKQSDGFIGYDLEGDKCQITHWMPLPTPPQK